MPSFRVLLRMFLILVLCTDGIFGAQAATRMAVRHIPPPSANAETHAVHGLRSFGRNVDGNDCNRFASAKQTGQGKQTGHDCDCKATYCDCSCAISFFVERIRPIFAAQHALTHTYLPPPVLPPLQRQVPRLFRPPIG